MLLDVIPTDFNLSHLQFLVVIKADNLVYTYTYYGIQV